MLADLTGNPDRQAAEREAVLTLSALVGAISMARAVDDPDLSQQIMANAAATLKERIPSPGRIAGTRGSPANREVSRREQVLVNDTLRMDGRHAPAASGELDSMDTAISHSSESSVVAVQLTRQHVVNMLRTAGLSDMADAAQRDLPDPVDSEQAAAWAARYGVNMGELMDRMGGSP